MLEIIIVIKDFLIGTIIIWGKIIGGLCLLVIIMIWVKFIRQVEILRNEVDNSISNEFKYLFKKNRENLFNRVEYEIKSEIKICIIKTLIFAFLGILLLVLSIVVPKYFL